MFNSNRHPITYRLGVIALCCSNFGHFALLIPIWGDLETTYAVHLKLIVKRVVDFLLVLIDLCSLGVTAEAIRANNDGKSAILLQRGQFDPVF